MKTVEVRRHSERADRSADESPLTERGRQMCLALAGRDYALVVSSPALRARETAELISGKPPRIDGRLLPDIGALPRGFWESAKRIADYDELSVSHTAARRSAEAQAAVWSELAAEVEEGGRVLVASHGAVVELGAIAVAQTLGTTLEGRVFGLCEGVEIAYDAGGPTAMKLLRVPPL